MENNANAKHIVLGLAGLLSLSACMPEDVEIAQGNPPGQITGTDGAADDGSGGEGEGSEGGASAPRCLLSGDENGASETQWQCGGRADVELFVDFDVPAIVPGDLNDFPSSVGGASFFFGPEFDEEYGAPAVMACCSDYPGDDGDPVEADYEDYPVYANACVADCVYQGRLAAIRELEALRDGELSKPGRGPARNQLQSLINWVKGPDGVAAWEAAFDGPSPHPSVSFDAQDVGVVEVPNSEDWKWLKNVKLEAQCRISSVSVPPVEDRLSCTSFEENDDVPWGAGLEDPDDFVSEAGGDIDLDGPVLFGIDADGAAPVVGLGDASSGRGCSTMSVDVVSDGAAVSLTSLTVRAPEQLVFQEAGGTLVLENLKLELRSLLEVPLAEAEDGGRFSLPPGSMRMSLSGEIHGVPLAVLVTNTFAVDGTLRGDISGRYDVELEPIEVVYTDENGALWNLLVVVDAWSPRGYAPKAVAALSVTEAGLDLDGSGSFDVDGDLVSYVWTVNGREVGEGPTLQGKWAESGTVTLMVEDRSGRQGFDVAFF
ncbi:MAG: hypothetical protein AAGA54_34915 [Myxococcota bacterium]